MTTQEKITLKLHHIFSWWRSGKQQETKGNHPSDIQSVWMDFLKSERN